MNNKLEKILIVSIVLILFFVAKDLLTPQIYQGNIPDPVQVELNDYESVNYTNDDISVSIDLLAEYNIEAVVKSKKKYSDYTSSVAKYDVALAWGDLNQIDIDSHIKYSQRGRWYYYNWDKDSLVSGSYISEHSSNVHLIAQNSTVFNKLKKINANDHIKLVGYLVNVNFADGSWNSSLSRKDTGDGACEILYVTEVSIIG